jgi:hypothetical protein
MGVKKEKDFSQRFETKDSRLRTVWYPTLNSVQSATQAVNTAAGWAFFIAAVTGTLGLYVLFFQPGQPLFGLFDERSLVDAVVALVLGWRIKAFSKPWGFVGVGYAILNLVAKVTSSTTSIGEGVFMSVLMVMVFFNAVRGMYAYDKFVTKPNPAEQNVPIERHLK